MQELRSSQVEQQELTSSGGRLSKVNPRTFFWCLILALGLLRVWVHRNDVTPDSISYIEIGWATARGGLHQVINAYWSPLYPFLLSLIFRYFHPPVQWEFTATHLLNFLVYVASLVAFEFFLKELILRREAGGESSGNSRPVSTRTVWTWGYLFFLWASYFWLGPEWVTPDLCVSVIVFLATGILLRIQRGRGNLLAFAILGALLGLGYLAKAAMFPLAFVFLFSALFLSRRGGLSARAATGRILVAAGVFAAFALPMVSSLSAQKGRVTFGDAGAINYATYEGGAPLWIHWHGQPAGSGVPTHPMRKLSSDPAIYEFARPISGSYPLWYDPSYWYEGIRSHFSLRGQAWALFRGANVYLKMISRTGALYGTFFALVLLTRKKGNWMFEGKELFWVWLPCFAAFAMYAIVHAEERFLSGFALMLLMWFMSSVRFSESSGRQFRRRMILLAGAAPALAIGWAVAHDIYRVVRDEPYEPWAVSQEIHRMGIPAGTEVGYIGTGLDAYWAHLASVRIIAEVPDGEEPRYVAADAARRRQLLALFSSVGAKFVITKNAAVANPADGWRPIPGTRHFIWEEQWLRVAPEKK